MVRATNVMPGFISAPASTAGCDGDGETVTQVPGFGTGRISPSALMVNCWLSASEHLRTNIEPRSSADNTSRQTSYVGLRNRVVPDCFTIRSAVCFTTNIPSSRRSGSGLQVCAWTGTCKSIESRYPLTIDTNTAWLVRIVLKLQQNALVRLC